MKRPLSAVAAFNRLIKPQGLHLRINKQRRIDLGFFCIVNIDSGQIVRRSVDLHEVGKYLRSHGTLPPPRAGEFDEPHDDGGAVLPPLR